MYGIIYKATCLVNGKVYIGQTVQKISIRKNAHYSDAKRQKYNMPFHRAIRKYGEENFIWEVIDHAENQDELNDKERYHIALHNSNNRSKGYNATIGGDGFGGKGEDNFWYGKERTEENKRQVSETLKKTRKEKGNPRSREVIQLTLNGEFVAEHKNAKIIEEQLNPEGNQKAVNACCRGKQKSAYGFLWTYKETYTEDVVKTLVSNYRNGKGTPKAVVQLTLDGQYVAEFKTIKEAIDVVGGSDSNLTACCKGRQNSHKGFKWVYKKDYQN
jgi:group I intron endonuclease